MKNVLFIDYFFPPLAADWRGIAFANYLPEYGWRPIVVSAAETVSYEKDHSLLGDIPPGTVVHRIGHPEPRGIRRHIRDRLKIAADFPDSYKSWIRPAILECEKILRENRIDVIYSASPAYSCAYVAMNLKRQFDIPWVADFLDGWADNDFLMKSYEKTLVRPLRSLQIRRIQHGESRILGAADRITVIHPCVKEQWIRRHNLSGDKISVVTDGYDERTFVGLRPNVVHHGKPTVAFLGSYYSAFEDDIKRFTRVLARFDERVHFLIIGRAAAWVREMNLPNTTVVEHLPRKDALAIALGCDFLFVTMPEYALWTPTKTYDYLRLGKPILGLLPQHGDAARILRDSHSGFVLSYDELRMQKELAEILAQWRNGNLQGFSPDRTFIEQFDRQRLTKKMAEIFNGLQAD